jgi:hypothetical protein
MTKKETSDKQHLMHGDLIVTDHDVTAWPISYDRHMHLTDEDSTRIKVKVYKKNTFAVVLSVHKTTHLQVNEREALIVFDSGKWGYVWETQLVKV